MAVETVNVIGTHLAVVDYNSALAAAVDLANGSSAAAVALANTHILAEARRTPSFCEALAKFDLILPDGMPLVWSMRCRGAAIRDRVYGPYFMWYALQNTPRPWKHFFFGGTVDTLHALSAAARRLQPDLDIVGTFSPPFRDWNERDNEYFAYKINVTEPDFVWIALGGVRQENWIIQNQFRFDRGVFLAVGDAFSLLAGQRPFAPQWMQKAGLTWLYRLAQEPKRLAMRYCKYNSLFVYYSLSDMLRRAPKS